MTTRSTMRASHQHERLLLLLLLLLGIYGLRLIPDTHQRLDAITASMSFFVQRESSLSSSSAVDADADADATAAAKNNSNSGIMRGTRSLNEGGTGTGTARAHFDVQLYLDLQFVDESLATDLESLDPSNLSVVRFCRAIQTQIFGAIVRNAAKAYNFTVVDDPLDCVISGTNRVYDPEAEDVFGYGYFSLQVHVSQRVVVESSDQTTFYLEAVQSIVETGFDVVSGGQREFRTNLYAASERFRSVLSVKIRRGLEAPVSPPSLAPTVPTGSEVPSEPPSLRPSLYPTVGDSAVPSGIPSWIPTAVPSGMPSGLPSVVPSNLPSEVPSGLPLLVPSGVPSDGPTTVIPSGSPSANLPEFSAVASYSGSAREHPARNLLIAGILGASIVLVVVSLVLCLLCYRHRKKERNRYRFPGTLPLSQSHNQFVPGVVELGEDRQSLADTTLGDPTQGSRARSRPPGAVANNNNLLDSFDENSLFTSPFPTMDEREERASAILPGIALLPSLSSNLMMPLEYEDKVVFPIAESVSGDSHSEGIEIPLGFWTKNKHKQKEKQKLRVPSPTETTRTENSSVPAAAAAADDDDDDEASGSRSGGGDDDDVQITRIEPLGAARRSDQEAPDDEFSRVPSDVDVWSVDFEDFDNNGSEYFDRGEERSGTTSLSSSASTHQIKNSLTPSRLLGESNTIANSSTATESSSSVKEMTSRIHGVASGDDRERRPRPVPIRSEDAVAEATGKKKTEEHTPSVGLMSKTETGPSRGMATAKKKIGRLPGSPFSSKESQSSKTTTLSFASQKTKTGAPTLESLGSGVVSTLTDLFDRMAIPKVTPEGKEVLYSERNGSNTTSRPFREEPNEPEIVKSASDDDSGISASPWLMEKIENTLGPKSVNADLASMSGKSQKSHYSKSRSSHGRRYGSEVSYGSSSYYSRFSSQDVGSIMSAVSSSMSADIIAQKQPEEISFVKTSRDTLEDGIKRLELQLAALDQKENDDTTSSVTMSSITAGSFSTISARSRTVRNRKRVLVIVPPGKLGVILADQHDGNGTVINSIKTGSPVTGVLKPGDRLIAVDEVAVIEMSCSQITSLIASRADRERRFTVMTTVVNQSKTVNNT